MPSMQQDGLVIQPSIPGHLVDYVLCFTSKTMTDDIKSKHTVLHSKKDRQYNTVVAFPAIVGGANGYAFIYTHSMDSTNC